MADFKMPQLGETVVEGTITRWLKSEGDSVTEDEPLVEVSTDKVDSEIPAPTSGTLQKINAQEGDTVSVGDVIAVIGDGEAAAPAEDSDEPAKDEDEDEPAKDEDEDEPAKDEDEDEPAKDEDGDEPAKEESRDEPSEPSETPEPKPESKPEPSEQPAAAPKPDKAPSEKPAASASLEATAEEPRRGILSPLVRKLASEHDVDLSKVRGTGTGGRITKSDIQSHLDSGAAAPAKAQEEAPAKAAPTEAAPEAAAPEGGEEIVQVGHMRKAIAEHMVNSIQQTARAWNTIEVDLSNIARLREKFGPQFKQKEGFSLTWTPFLTKAVTQVLLRHPNINSTWNGDGTVTRKHFVNMGIAVALENGLIVPVIKGADGMNLVGLARAVRDLATRARSKKLVPDDVAGGTFTITNPGPFGSIISLPIINKGQAGILAFDAVVKRPVVVTDENGEDSIAIRHMVFLSLSWDHRIIDGAEAAVFLRDLKEALESEDYSGDLSAYSS